MVLPVDGHLLYSTRASAQQLFVDKALVCGRHASTMTLEEHKLQLLRQKYLSTLGWFSAKLQAVVTVGSPDPRTSAFSMTATWDGGAYTKRFDPQNIRQLGRRGCALHFAEEFVREALRARGRDVDE
jgi:hypothetical protein